MMLITRGEIQEGLLGAAQELFREVCAAIPTTLNEPAVTINAEGDEAKVRWLTGAGAMPIDAARGFFQRFHLHPFITWLNGSRWGFHRHTNDHLLHVQQQTVLEEPVIVRFWDISESGKELRWAEGGVNHMIEQLPASSFSAEKFMLLEEATLEAGVPYSLDPITWHSCHNADGTHAAVRAFLMVPAR